MRNLHKTILIVLVTLVLAIVCLWGYPAYLKTVFSPVETYDYLIFQNAPLVKAKNGRNGAIDLSSTNTSAVINQAIAEGNSIYIKAGEYTPSSDILVHNKKSAQIISDGAIIRCNGRRIIIKGDNYTSSQHNTLSSLEIINGTIRIENSFKTTITNIVFRNCTTAIEFANTKTWSEGAKIENCYFQNCSESIVFRTPINPATGSYANTEINRCYFELSHDDSVGIEVEPNADFTGSLMHNVRIWIGHADKKNQTGISVEGSMLQTLLQNVVFESFAESPSALYGIVLGQAAESPTIGGEVSFLGNWTARVYNPSDKWIFGLGGAFKREDVSIPVGLGNTYSSNQSIDAYHQKIADFKTRIQVAGTFGYDETVTVRFRLEFIDNTVSKSAEKSFNQTGTLWLGPDDMLKLLPSQNVIWAIIVDAKTSQVSTNAIVQVDIYGTTA